MSWKTFIQTRWDSVSAADFFTIEVWGMRGTVTFYGLPIIELSSRRVYFAGATRNPITEWMMQFAPNLTDPFDGFVSGKRVIIIDRDRKYCDAFRAMLENAGTEPLGLSSPLPELECLGRAVRQIDQRRMFRQDDPVR